VLCLGSLPKNIFFDDHEVLALGKLEYGQVVSKVHYFSVSIGNLGLFFLLTQSIQN